MTSRRQRLRAVVWDQLTETDRRSLLRRSAVPDRRVRDGAAAICDDVASRGDAAVLEYASTLGGGFRRIEPAAMSAALGGLPSDIRDALQASVEAVRTYHLAQIPTDITVTTAPGVEITRRWAPLRRVGAYVPGGKASYPSTVVMTVVPARVAGTGEVVVASPEGPDGEVSSVLLAACALTGVDELWAMGGAQAVAALAYGTASVAPVEKIVGPGNAWVTAAKLAVYGTCAIDLPAGPSEVLVFADATADPALIAVDLLCQAEHGPDSPALLVTTDPTLPGRVEDELDLLVPALERSDILEVALSDHGAAIVVGDREAAIDLINAYAGEHVTIMTSDPDRDAKAITAAGSVYIGRWAAESAGDYATGANHVLPTGGLAGAAGPLSVEDFGSWRQEQRITEAGLAGIADTIATLATAEGLTAHRLAALLRLSRP